jgi:hypothetical protein
MQNIVNHQSEPSHRTDIVLASTLFLFSSYVRGRSNENLKNILLKHLSILADDPTLSPVVRGVCEQLELDWCQAPAPLRLSTQKSNELKSPLVWLFGKN